MSDDGDDDGEREHGRRRERGREPPCRSDLQGGRTYLTEVKGRNASFHPLSGRKIHEYDYARPWQLVRSRDCGANA